MKKHIWRWVLLLVAVVLSDAVSMAVNINSALELKNALGNEASISGNIVTLNSDKTISETLNILDGEMTLVIPEGVTLTADFSNIKGDAIAINVNGSGVNFVLKGGGVLNAIAKKGDDGTIGNKDGKNGENVRTLCFTKGKLQLFSINIKGTPGEGGKGYDGWISDGKNGNRGETWILDPDDENKLKIKDTLAPGYYIKNATSDNYESAGYQTEEVIVDIITYQVTYNFNEGQKLSDGSSSYTVDTKDFKLPSTSKNGYDFTGWKYNDNNVEVNNLPIPVDMWGETVGVDFVAGWSVIHYTIDYELDGGTLDGTPKTSYTIEDETFELLSPTKDGYEFTGWYNNDGVKVEKILKGTTGNMELTARWVPLYTVNYEYDKNKFKDVTFTREFSEYRKNLPYTIPTLTSKDENLEFAGWYYNDELVKVLTLDWFQKKVGADKGGVVTLEAKASEVYIATLHWNSSDMSGATTSVRFTSAIEKDLPMNGTKRGYKLLGWCFKEDCSDDTPITEIPVGINNDINLYAKWELVRYTIKYDYLYNGTLPSDAPQSYTVEDEVVLPNPTRPNFSFVTWHTMESTYWGENTGDKDVDKIEKNTIGNRTFYAEWKGGRSVIIRQPEGGKITVKLGDEEIASETIVDPGKKLTVSVAATSSAFKFKQLWVNGEMYETQPIEVTMPDTCGITISALMDDGRPQASAPSMSVSPENVSALPAGGSAEVTLYGGESGGKLYYRIGGIEKEYTGKFLVTSSKEGVVVVEGISRKEGYKDGVTTREITFGTGNISITFDLPEGITAVNPDGGEVETAVATGGSFKFKLVVDSKIIETPATAIKVYANGRQLSRGTGNTYVLSELKENVTVTVGNVEYKSFAVKLKQTDGGRIAFVGIAGDSCSVVYGDTIQLEAFPNAGYFFTAWNDNTKQNPRELIVKKAQTVSATFSKEKMVYMVTFPQIEGVTVKTLSGYSQQVDKNGTCKFWLDIDAQYKSSEPVVKVNGEVIEPTETGVYSLYYIREHKSVSVEGITRDKITLSQKTNTSITNVETGKDATKEGLYAGDMVTLYAKAPAGKMFSKWNDGVTENPRMMTASDAQGVQPLFISASGETESLSFTLPAGAGVVSLSGNLNAVEKGGSARFKIVLLPQYAGSKIVVKAAEKVLQQEMELRASTEAETYVYSLNNISENTTVTVEGLTLGSYTLTLEQTENGKVEADKTGEQLYGTVVNLTATPEAEYMFLRWSDGNTLNPYPYTITKNVTLKAEFLEADKMVVDNEEIAAQDARIYTANGSLYVELSQPSDLKVWNFSGVMLINRDIAPGLSSYPLPAGDYLVRVGNNKVVKVMVK